MKTLIIHPSDPSTGFLDVVYAPIQDKTVITGGYTQNEVRRLIDKHDRIIMMGHGSPRGLFSVNQFWDTYGYIIDHTMVDILKQKDNSVFIWCNADRFVRTHGLQGYFSGMFISEVVEARYCGLWGITQDMVDESNYGFCEIMAKHINEEKDLIFENVGKEYGLIAETNNVAKYNHQRLFLA